MSPKNTLNLAKHRLQRCRQPPHKSDKKKKKKKHDKTKRKSDKKKKRSEKLKLNESEANKTLYICFTEEDSPQDGDRVCYVVRSIKLSDLLSSDSVDHLQLRQVGFKSGDDLPGFMDCGVLGSQIVFAGGKKPAIGNHPDPTWHRDVYVFETDPEKQPPGDSSVIRKLDDAKLLGGKYVPVVTELGGKLYALSYKPIPGHPSFEVFDPEMGTWSALPEPPFFGRYHFGGPLAYAITGTKMFACLASIRACPASMIYRCPVFCFDVAQPDREWRLVDSMCQRGPFPFLDRALVLDLPGDHSNNKKIMFGYEYRWHLGVYIMFLDENRESVTKIADLNLPMLPEEFISPCQCYIVHIGGQKACLVAPQMNLLERPAYPGVVGSHKTRGVVIPFQFEVDTTKIDKDAKNCLTLQFMPTRIFEFYTSPSTYPSPGSNGCFVL